jgi:hypothetical protein
VSDPLSLTPIWVTATGLFAAMFAAALYGRLVRIRDERRGAGGAESQEGYIVAAVTGLLALLLGFTFSLAIDRFETRRILVLDEANAIGTTYLRAQLLEEPHRTRVSDLLIAYTDNHLALGSLRDPAASPLAAESQHLTTDLWTATVAAFPSIKDLDFSSTFVDGMNEVINLGAARRAARYARVPTIVFALLIVYEIITAGVLGYVLIARRGTISGAVLIILFGLSLLLIVDIDRPTIGSVREPQSPMIWLRENLADWPPQTFDRLDDAAAPD